METLGETVHRALQEVIAADEGSTGAVAATAAQPTTYTSYGAGHHSYGSYGAHGGAYGGSGMGGGATYQNAQGYDSAVYGATGANAWTMYAMMGVVTMFYMVLFVAMTMSCYMRPAIYGYARFHDVEAAGPAKPPMTGVVAQLDAQWRKAFITKVYFILCCQLALTVGICFSMMQFGGYELAMWIAYEGYWTRMASFLLCIVTLVGLMCYKNKHPHNLVLLGAFTCTMSYLVGLTCTMYAAAGMGVLVVEAFAITSVLFVALTLFTMWSKIDFSFLGLILPCLLLILMIWGLFTMVFFDSFAFRQVYALAGCVIFVLYILYDTWQITNMLEYDDYVIGAVNLYLDFINLFLFVLQLLTGGRRE